MAWYTYAYKAAFDPETQNIAPVGSAGQAFAVSDNTFSAPVPTYDLTGIPQELVAAEHGFLPSFMVEDHVELLWKSGEYVFHLNTTTPLVGPQGEPGLNGEDGSNVIPTAAAIAAEVTTPGALAKQALDAKYARGVSAAEYGAMGDGETDDLPALQAALNRGGIVFIPEGTYLVNGELLIPSHTIVVGAGIDKTVIRSHPDAGRHLNTVTNANNNRQYRIEYNSNIYISDLTIDGNRDARVETGGTWDGNASGLMLSTANDVVVERVKVINTPLHGIAVDASSLTRPGDESHTFYPPGPSYNVTIRDCEAINAYGDDGFTTHYSHDILFDNCRAIRTVPHTEGGGINNGFEVDDGSSRVTIRNCYAYGWANGFEAKGHTGAPPAYDVTMDNCVAENCSNSFTFTAADPSIYPQVAGIAKNIKVLSCTSLSPVPFGGANNPQTAVKIYGYDGVVFRDFVTTNSPTGGFIIHQGAKNVLLDGIRGENVWTAPPLDDGFIRLTTAVKDNVTVRNLVITTPVKDTLVRNSGTDSALKLVVEGVIASCTDATKPAISDSFYSDNRDYRRLNVTGFSAPVNIRGGSGAGNTLTSLPYIRAGNGTPEGKIATGPGALYVNLNGGASTTLYVKTSGTGTTGWTAK